MAYNSNGEETISILNVEIEPAVKSIADLKANIKALKDTLSGLEIGETKYKETLAELKVNQNALKDAMYATNTTIEDLAKSANGTAKTYNGLVARMADLKTQLRSTDVSTEKGRETFNKLASQINEVNDQLKEMDALQGNFQRNVGNYVSHWKGLSDTIKDFGDGLDIANGNINGFAKGIGAIGKSPAIATFAILLSAVTNIADKMKDNETFTNAWKKAMDAFKPVLDFFSGVLDRIANVLADLIGKTAEFLGSSGIFAKVIDGVVGIGNAVLQFVIAPFKGVIEAIKIFKEQGVKGFGDASKAFLAEMKSGVSFKNNFEAGKVIAETILSGVKSKKEETTAEAVKVGEEVGESIADGIRKGYEKASATAQKLFDEELKERLALQKELDAEAEAELAKTNEEIDKYFAEQEKRAEESKKKQEEIAKARVEAMYMVADATSSIMSSLADIYESDTKNSEKNEKKIKALRIASTTMDTISGAVSAFMSVWKSEMPFSAKVVTAPAMSASVLATGMAQIAKIKSTSASSSTASSASSASVSAPAVEMNVPNVRQVSSASEEQRLNYMARDKQVYILSSDIEADREMKKVQVAETSF